MASKMKDSGVEWIGEIPEEWEVKRVKYLIAGIADGTHGTHERYNEGRPLLSAKNVFNDGLVIGSNESLISERDYRQIVASGFPKKDDVLVSCVGSIGRTCVYELEEPIAFQRSVVFLRPNKSITSKMLKYGMESKSTLVQEKLRIKQSAQAGIYQGDVCELFIAVPPINEQEQIIRLVESKLDKIDTAVSTIEKEIDVLERYKASLIHETVTKGLNPNAPMKDSGVEWIGEIPEGWEVTKVKYLASGPEALFLDGDWIESDVIEASGVRYLTSGNVGAGYYKKQGNGHISKQTFNKLNCLAVYPGDLLISRLNMPIGRACLAPKEASVYVVAVDVVVVRGDAFDTRYMVYAMNDISYASEIAMIARGSTMQRISRSMLGNQFVWLPPKEEQSDIADYLDSICFRVNRVAESKRKQLELLKRQRQSLIYEYVTGKKRVPGYGEEA